MDPGSAAVDVTIVVFNTGLRHGLVTTAGVVVPRTCQVLQNGRQLGEEKTGSFRAPCGSSVGQVVVRETC